MSINSFCISPLNRYMTQSFTALCCLKDNLKQTTCENLVCKEILEIALKKMVAIKQQQQQKPYWLEVPGIAWMLTN